MGICPAYGLRLSLSPLAANPAANLGRRLFFYNSQKITSDVHSDIRVLRVTVRLVLTAALQWWGLDTPKCRRVPPSRHHTYTHPQPFHVHYKAKHVAPRGRLLLASTSVCVFRFKTNKPRCCSSASLSLKVHIKLFNPSMPSASVFGGRSVPPPPKPLLHFFGAKGCT